MKGYEGNLDTVIGSTTDPSGYVQSHYFPPAPGPWLTTVGVKYDPVVWARLSAEASHGSQRSLILVYPIPLARAVRWFFCASIVLLNASGPAIVFCTRTSEMGSRPTSRVQAFM